MRKAIQGRIVPFQIPKSDREFIRYQEDCGVHFYDRLHQHPEIQLTLIRAGYGQFMSRDYIGRFEPGDIFLLGENVPHVFRSDPEFFEVGSKLNSHSLTIFFDLATMHQAVKEVEDLRSLSTLNQFSGKAFQILGERKVVLADGIRGFHRKKGLSRLGAGLEFLDLILSGKPELISLGKDELPTRFSEKDGQRMNRIIQFILANQSNKISLEEVAGEANLSKEAFCRFFKERTRMTFTEYLNQLRIMEAKKLLENSNSDITQLAFQVGFENMSYFHRVFRRQTGKTPLQYRKQLLQTSA